MKTLISSLLLMLNVWSAYCQYPFSNNLNDDVMSANSTKSISSNCTRNSIAFSTKYNKLTYYIPNSNTPVKTIRLNFNIFQDNNGLNNFPDNQTTRDRFTQIMGWLNDKYTSNCQPSDPITGVAFVSDTRVRFELQGIYFYQNTTLQSSGWLPTLLTNIRNTDVSRMDQLNICFTEGSYGQASGYAFTPSFDDISVDQGLISFHKYANGSTVGDYACAVHFAHELGHCLDLFHTYDGNGNGIYEGPPNDGCCPESCNSSDNDFLDDVFDLNAPNWCNHPAGCSICYHQGGWNMTPDDPTNYSTNNIMGADQQACYFSPKQMGKIHRALSLSSAGKYINGCTNNSNNLTLNSQEVWDFNMRLDGNININNLGSLSLTCGLEMPDMGQIFVNSGGKLTVNANIINSCGNGWTGITVQSGGYLELNTTTIADYSIEVKSGGTLRIIGGLTISGNNHIDIESGGYICVDNSITINLTDPLSVINLHNGYNLGVNTAFVTNPGTCNSILSSINKIGSGFIYEFNDVFIQNESLTGNQYIPGNNISAGTNVTTSKPQGPVVIKSGANIVFDADGNILLDKGFEVELGATFEAK